MRRMAIGTFLVLTGCGSAVTDTASKIKSLEVSPSLSLDRTNTRFEKVDVSTGGNTKLIFENTDFQTPRRLERAISSVSLSDSTPDQDIIALATKAAAELNPDTELSFLSLNRGARFAYVTFQQMHQRLEVFGAKLVLRMNGEGNWMTSSSTLVNAELLKSVPAVYTKKISSSQYIKMVHHLVRERSVVYPRRDDNGEMKLHLAREFVAYAMNEHQELWVWVDENSLEAIGAYNSAENLDTVQIKGSIYPDSPSDTPVEMILPSVTAILDPTKKVVADMNGNFDRTLFSAIGAKIVLENEFISVYNNAKANREYTVDAATVSNSINIDAGPSAEDRNAFYWIMVARKTITEKLKYSGMSYKLGVFTNYGNNLDNAFFMPLTKTLSFGAGGTFFKNTAQSRDVVIHEFGHAVTTAIYGVFQNFEFNAMNEAFSDYLAASITNDPEIGNGAMHERSGMKYLRTLDNPFVYPKDFSGTKFHSDGQMFSGALWDLRKAVGADLVDQMVHEARLAQAKTIAEFMLELLVIDEKTDDKNPWTASKHSDAIWKAFSKHGLMSTVSFNQAPAEDLTIPWKRPKQSMGCLSFN